MLAIARCISTLQRIASQGRRCTRPCAQAHSSEEVQRIRDDASCYACSRRAGAHYLATLQKAGNKIARQAIWCAKLKTLPQHTYSYLEQGNGVPKHERHTAPRASTDEPDQSTHL